MKTIRKFLPLGWLVLTCVGCQTAPRNQTLLAFNQAPPAVRSAFMAYYGSDMAVQQVSRELIGGQYYYNFTYIDRDGSKREVELNEGGDQINQR